MSMLLSNVASQRFHDFSCFKNENAGFKPSKKKKCEDGIEKISVFRHRAGTEPSE